MNSTVTLVNVGIAEAKVAQPPVNLSVIGLGSCVGVCLYDNSCKLGGIAHVMLPDSSRGRGKINRAKYADTAVEVLLEEMLAAGANRWKIQAKIAGGAQMFPFGDNGSMLVGARNVESVKQALDLCKIPLVGEDCGGCYGRTIVLNTDTGLVHVKTIKHGEKVI